jgi:hypothetical protein
VGFNFAQILRDEKVNRQDCDHATQSKWRKTYGELELFGVDEENRPRSGPKSHKRTHTQTYIYNNK